MPRKRYGDAEKAKALAALDANGGNLGQTANQLGIPRKTLEGWARGRGAGPAVADLRREKRGDLLAAVEDLAWLLLGQLNDPAKVRGAAYNHVATAFGIAMDKRHNLLAERLAERVAALEAKQRERDSTPVLGEAGAAGGRPGGGAAPAP